MFPFKIIVYLVYLLPKFSQDSWATSWPAYMGKVPVLPMVSIRPLYWLIGIPSPSDLCPWGPAVI